jgi:sulfotransferase
LAEVLRQNPEFSVTPTSALHAIAAGALEGRDSAEWMAHYDQDEQKGRLMSALRGLLFGWFHEARVGVDKSRGWLMRYPLLKEIMGEAPIYLVCPVRDIRGVLASMERLFRADPTFTKWPGEYRGKLLTLEGRIEMYLNTPPLAPALVALKERVIEGSVRRMYVVRAEDFTTYPGKVLPEIYTYLGETPFAHDVTNVEQPRVEHDPAHQSPFADHRIQEGPIRPLSDTWRDVIPPSLSEAIVGEYRWFYSTFYPEVLQSNAA